MLRTPLNRGCPGFGSTKKDARNITITTGYDALNRPLNTTFTDSTPPVTFCYDGTDYTGSGCTTGQVVGKKGRLTAVGSSVSTMRFSTFDAVGRILASEQETDGFQYNFAYTYNKAGGLETQEYPSGFEVETCYDDAGRIDKVTNNGTSALYASSPDYAPHGALSDLKLGNNLWSTATSTIAFSRSRSVSALSRTAPNVWRSTSPTIRRASRRRTTATSTNRQSPSPAYLVAPWSSTTATTRSIASPSPPRAPRPPPTPPVPPAPTGAATTTSTVTATAPSSVGWALRRTRSRRSR